MKYKYIQNSYHKGNSMLILSNFYLIYMTEKKKTVLYFTDFKSDVFLLADHKLFLDYSTKKFELFLHYIDMESIALKAKIKLKQRKRLEIPSADTSSGAPDSVRGILH